MSRSNGKKIRFTIYLTRWYFILCYAFGVFTVSGQTKQELLRKKQDAIREINLTNELIKQTERSRKASLNDLILVKRKINLRKGIINNVQEEIEVIDKQIIENTELLVLLNDDLEMLKEEYARMIYFAYKNRGSYQKMAFLFASEDFNQAYKRVKYFQQYSGFRKRQAVVIERMSDLIGEKRKKLEELRLNKEKLLKQNEQEANNLMSEEKDHNRMVVQLQGTERELRKKLREKERIAEELEKAIQILIAEEARKARNFETLTPEERLIADNFKNNKGRLPWPTERGVITGRFGVQEHPVLKGVKIENFGIDIATVENAYARAVFEGEVKKIIGIPGANQAVIIQHGNFFSVYQNLVNVSVKAGEKVRTKEYIGTIYTDKEDENKTVLSFMIWEEKEKLDPLPWLSGN